MVDNAKENLSKLSARFDDLKDKITGNISDYINLKNKDSHPSKIFTEEPADLIELKIIHQEINMHYYLIIQNLLKIAEKVVVPY